jgi:E3 Ubiquitin Ligase RBR C-terminal domain
MTETKLHFHFLFHYQINNIDFDTEASPASEGVKAHVKCPVQLQKETPSGLVDAVCSNEIQDGHAGLCRLLLLLKLNELLQKTFDKKLLLSETKEKKCLKQ